MQSTKTDRSGAAFPEEDSAAVHAAELLRLAAAPVFGIMTVLTIFAGGAHEMSCCSESHMSWSTGMTLMYLLMSLFHLPAWLKLVSVRRERARAAGRSLPEGSDRNIGPIEASSSSDDAGFG
jgi:uncharacterized membrane protein